MTEKITNGINQITKFTCFFFIYRPNECKTEDHGQWSWKVGNDQQEILATPMRFTSIRGYPWILCSDNGPQLKLKFGI